MAYLLLLPWLVVLLWQFQMNRVLSLKELLLITLLLNSHWSVLHGRFHPVVLDSGLFVLFLLIVFFLVENEPQWLGQDVKDSRIFISVVHPD